MNTQDIQQPESFNVLLIGDSCVDEYKIGTIDRLSPEAPVPVIKIVEDFVQSRWNEYNQKNKQEQIRKEAFRKAFMTYRNFDVDFGGARINNFSTNRNQIIVKNPNGTAAVLNYSEVNGEVQLSIHTILLGNVSTDSVIEALGNMK